MFLKIKVLIRNSGKLFSFYKKDQVLILKAKNQPLYPGFVQWASFIQPRKLIVSWIFIYEVKYPL